MSTVNVGGNVGVPTQAFSDAGSAVQVPTNLVKGDAEVVSQAASTAVFKPSNVAEASQPSRDVVAKAAADLQQFVQSMGRNLSFSIDESTGYHVVRVVNPDTGELVRQLPSEELLKISRDFQRLNNVLVSQKA